LWHCRLWASRALAALCDCRMGAEPRPRHAAATGFKMENAPFGTTIRRVLQRSCGPAGCESVSGWPGQHPLAGRRGRGRPKPSAAASGGQPPPICSARSSTRIVVIADRRRGRNQRIQTPQCSNRCPRRRRRDRRLRSIPNNTRPAISSKSKAITLHRKIINHLRQDIADLNLTAFPLTIPPDKSHGAGNPPHSGPVPNDGYLTFPMPPGLLPQRIPPKSSHKK